MEQEKKITLSNKHGQTHEFLLRCYRRGDEEGVIACIREEYGASYFRQELYFPLYIRMEAVQGRTTFLVAENESGQIAGILLLKQFYPKESMCEMASLILRKKYRRLGLAGHFLAYGMKQLSSAAYSAAICLPVLFHDVSQRLLYRQGLRATGMILNVFDREQIPDAYGSGRNQKHSQGIQICAMRKRNAKELYLPAEHWDFCTRIYESLGVDYYLVEEEENYSSNGSGISLFYHEKVHNLEIYIDSVGLDLEEKLDNIYTHYPLLGMQTANVFLNCNDPKAVWAYDILEKKGHFFTGLKPLCSDKEYMVLHHCGEVEIYFDDYVLSKEFQQLADYIKKCYESRRKHG